MEQQTTPTNRYELEQTVKSNIALLKYADLVAWSDRELIEILDKELSKEQAK